MRRFWQILAIMTILATAVASPMCPISNLPLPTMPKAHGTARTIVLVGNYLYGWNSSNPPITVYRGDSVSLALSSGDGTQHQFVVDVDKDGKIAPTCPPDKCSNMFPPSATYSFTADFTGSYTYYCTYHPASMFGSFTVNGPDFSVSSNPSSLSIPQGSKANSTISVASLGNFAGSVTLSSSPSSPPGLMTSGFSVNPVTVPAGGVAKSNFTISVPAGTSPGTYGLTVTGSNSTISRNTSLSVTVTVPDFTIISSPSSLNIPQGSSGMTTLTLTSLNGFSGTVSLTSTISSNGPQITFSPASVGVPSGGSISSTLSVSAASSGAYSTAVSQGSYTVTVTGTSSSSVHSTTISLAVGSSSAAGGLPGTAIIGGGIAAAIAV